MAACAGHKMAIIFVVSFCIANSSNAEVAYTNRAREAINAAGQLALRNSQSEFGDYHLAFVLFDARHTRGLVDPRVGPQPLHSATSIGAKVAAAAGALQRWRSER